MLLRFSVQNHRSIRDRIELNLVASTAIKDSDRVLIRREGLGVQPGVLPLAIIYGANASGKSNVLHALNAMAQAVLNSYRRWKEDGGVHRWPFCLEKEWRTSPSQFQVDIAVEGVRYQYGFEVNDRTILREWLRAWPQGKRRTWFERGPEGPIKFGRALTGVKPVEGLTRPNSLFLSAAAQAGHERLTPVARWFDNVRLATRDNEGPRLEYAAQQIRSRGWERVLRDLLAVADLGISHANVVEHKLAKTEQDRVVALLQAVGGMSADEARTEASRPHPRLVLKHRARGGPVALTMDEESDGTKALLSLAYPVLNALSRGEVLLVDELESSMHPDLVQALVGLFLGPETNAAGGQLLCATHNTYLLNTPELRRDSVWFTEKDRDGATNLFPLTDFRTRKEANLETGYVQGRFGGVPALGDFADVTRAVTGGS